MTASWRRACSRRPTQRRRCRSALMFLANRAGPGKVPVDLNGILTVPDLNHVEWVRSSKVRAAEALFLERLLTVTRELLPPEGLYK